MEGDINLIKKAIVSFQRVREFTPKNPAPLRFLAIANAEIGLEEDAKAMLAPVVKKGANLRQLMYIFPKKNPELREKIANALLKAGLPGETGGYFKIFEDKRLDDKEIKNLIFGHTITGLDSKTGEQWRIDRTSNGEATYESGETSDTGSSWVENNMLCNQWNSLYGSMKDCMPIFKNPEPRPGKDEEYLAIPVYGILPFSVVH